MTGRKQPSCAVPLCSIIENYNTKRRYFFRFPKEHDRWLQWIRACGRLDLQPKGPEYAYQNCHLCHLHFEKKWYNVNKINARLHPDAVPTLFGLHLEQENTEATDIQVVEMQEETSNANTSDIIPSEILPITTVIHDIEAGKVKPSTSGSQYIKTSSDDSPRKRKLRLKIKRLQAQNRSLRETVRRLRLEKKNTKKIKSKEVKINEYKHLKKLGHKLFPDNFNKILMAQVNAQLRKVDMA